MSAYRGRVLLIDSWAAWCGPCTTVLSDLRALVPALERLLSLPPRTGRLQDNGGPADRND